MHRNRKGHEFESSRSSLIFLFIYLFSGFNFTTAEVVCIAVMINHVFISFSADQIYDISYIHLQDSHV